MEKIDKIAISSYDNYCDSYVKSDLKRNGFVAVLKASTSQVKKTNDFLLDTIILSDKAETNDALMSEINFDIKTSYCGELGQIWGYNLAQADVIKNNTQIPFFNTIQFDGSNLPIYDIKPLLDAGTYLFGSKKNPLYPPFPGSNIDCLHKKITAFRPLKVTDKEELKSTEAFGVWCFISVTISKGKNYQSDVFIEDFGLWKENDDEKELINFLESRKKEIAWSITESGKNKEILYHSSYIGYSYLMIDPGYVGTALACIPYISLAKNAIPVTGYKTLKTISLSEWVDTRGDPSLKI
jgi:histidine decarboxylase